MFSRKTTIVCAAAVALIGTTVASQAAVYTVATLDGSQTGFGYDPDSTAPQVTSSGFYAQGDAGEYHAVVITPEAIGLSGLTLGDIQSIAYDTKQVGGTMDWQAIVYTADQNGSGSGWYGVRFKYGLNSGEPHDWETTSRDFQNNMLNRILNGTTDGYPTDPQSDEYILNNNPTEYNSLLDATKEQEVLYIDFYLGAQNGGTDFDSYLNNIQINTNLGNATINAVPEPSSLAVFVGLGGLALLSRRTRRKIA